MRCLPRSCAQRPLPSMMTAIWRGTLAGARRASARRFRVADVNCMAVIPFGVREPLPTEFDVQFQDCGDFLSRHLLGHFCDGLSDPVFHTLLVDPSLAKVMYLQHGSNLFPTQSRQFVNNDPTSC